MRLIPRFGSRKPAKKTVRRLKPTGRSKPAVRFSKPASSWNLMARWRSYWRNRTARKEKIRMDVVNKIVRLSAQREQRLVSLTNPAVADVRKRLSIVSPKDETRFGFELRAARPAAIAGLTADAGLIGLQRKINEQLVLLDKSTRFRSNAGKRLSGRVDELWEKMAELQKEAFKLDTKISAAKVKLAQTAEEKKGALNQKRLALQQSRHALAEQHKALRDEYQVWESLLFRVQKYNHQISFEDALQLYLGPDYQFSQSIPRSEQAKSGDFWFMGGILKKTPQAAKALAA